MLKGIDVLNTYRELVQQNEAVCLHNYNLLKNKINSSSLRHSGNPISFIYNPLFYGYEEIRYLEQICTRLAEIMEKVTMEYLHNPSLKKYFSFPHRLEELIMLDPGYPQLFPMARFDVFYDFFTRDVKFCELNTDGSSGMAKSLLLEQEFLENPIINSFQNTYNLSSLDPVQNWVEALLVNYNDFAKDSKNIPNIAIMDVNWQQQGMVTEFIEFKEKFESRGCTTVICDPRDFRYTNGELLVGDLRIDLIYRRAVTSDLLNIIDDISDLIAGLKKKAVCMVGSFRSQVIHNKLIFSLLHERELTSFLTTDERLFIEKYIPYTSLVKETNKSEILKGRSRWVLKPLDSYQSQGVFIGRDYNNLDWQSIVDGVKPGEYLFQEFIEVPKVQLVNFAENRIAEQYYNQMIGLFMYNGKFSGFYTRVSPLLNIASSLGAVAVPNYIVDKK